jgi:transposase-like protein
MAGKTHRIGKSIIEVSQAFATEEACLMYLEAARWPEGVRCPTCGDKNLSKFVAKGKTRVNKHGIEQTGPDRHLYQCLNTDCKQQFSAKVGTVFNDTHLSLNKWFMAIAIMCNAKKGASAKQIERDLGVSYKTAWYLCHRIRKAMDEGMGLFTGVVECDETFVGGRYDRRRNREPHQKQAVFGALQRGTDSQPSKVRTFPIHSASKAILTGAVKGTVSVEADLLITDQNVAYRKVGRDYRGHETVNHIALEFRRRSDPRNIHTNTIENFWSNFKRGLIGSFHQVSLKHLQRYLNEFEFRFNNRHDEGMFALVVINLAIKVALPYATLTGGLPSSVQPLPSSDEPF